MIAPETILTRIIDGVPPGVPLDGWLRRRVGDVRRAVAVAYATAYKGGMTPTTRPEVTDTEIVTEQFTPVRVVAFDVDQARAAAAADTLSPARRAELIAKRAEAQDDLKYGGRLSMGQQTELRSMIRAINAELAGNANQKAAAKWLAARAKKSPSGEFDPAVVAAAFKFLPGWKIKETSTLAHIIDYNDEDLLHYTLGIRRRVDAGLLYEKVGPSGRYSPSQWFVEFPPTVSADTVVVVPLVKRRAATDHPVVGAVYSATPPVPFDWGEVHSRDKSSKIIQLLTAPAVGVRAWTVTAPTGEGFTVRDKPQRAASAGLEAPGLYKWSYTQGLDKAAAAVVGEAEAAIPADAGTETAWARNLCQICFRAHALTPSGKLVDHAHRRRGWGYNVNPCPGSKALSYALACDLTDDYASSLTRQLAFYRARVARLVSGVEDDGSGIVFTITVYTLDANGRKIKEPDAGRAAQYGPYVVEDRRVPPGDPLWLKVRDAETAKAREHIQQIVKSIPFYRAAVRLWRLPPPGETASETLARIWSGISPVDREGL